jgi:Fe-S-cluster-containing dehydrogenase component
MKTRYVMTMDTRLCVGCKTCVLGCKAENNLPENGFRDWVVTETRGQFPTLFQEIRSERCNHCSKPACVSACPTGASHVSDGGTILVTHHKCSGCKACLAACPYDARYIHPSGGYADKCTFCSHRVKKNLLPGCVSNCPTRALSFGDVNDPKSIVSKQLRRRRYKMLKPEKGLEPNHYFLL